MAVCRCGMCVITQTSCRRFLRRAAIDLRLFLLAFHWQVPIEIGLANKWISSIVESSIMLRTAAPTLGKSLREYYMVHLWLIPLQMKFYQQKLKLAQS